MFDSIKKVLKSKDNLPTGFSKETGRRHVYMSEGELRAALTSTKEHCRDTELREAINFLAEYYCDYDRTKIKNLCDIVYETAIVTTIYDDDMAESHCITDFDMDYSQRSKIMNAYHKHLQDAAEKETALSQQRKDDLDEKFNDL